MANVKHTKRNSKASATKVGAPAKKQPLAAAPRSSAPPTQSTKVKKASAVAGWLQDVSLEAPVSASALQLKPGERELEFSVAMRKQGAAPQTLAELRARVLVHARGSVLVLAEASYMAPIAKGADEAALLQDMYQPLRQALQGVLTLAGHTPPLPETLEKAS